MDPIVITVDEETRYAKLNLYYGDDLLEDYYLGIHKQIVQAIFENVRISDAAAATKAKYLEAKDKYIEAKDEIKAKYIEVRNEDNDTNTKGKALEEVIRKLLELVPELEIADSRVDNGIQEIDITVRNYNKTRVWEDFESVFFVECKNWFKDKADAKSIGDLRES
jgi:hypothetical protein